MQEDEMNLPEPGRQEELEFDWARLNLPQDELNTLDNVIRQRRFDREEMKEDSARRVAFSLVIIFGATIGFVLLGVAILFVCAGADDAGKYLAAARPVLDDLSNFLTAVFGPLLGFVLGYYFSEKQK